MACRLWTRTVFISSWPGHFSSPLENTRSEHEWYSHRIVYWSHVHLHTCHRNSDMFRLNQDWNLPGLRNDGFGAGVFQVQKRQAQNSNSSLLKEVVLLKPLVLFIITSWAMLPSCHTAPALHPAWVRNPKLTDSFHYSFNHYIALAEHLDCSWFL